MSARVSKVARRIPGSWRLAAVCASVMAPSIAMAAQEVWDCDLEGEVLRYSFDRGDLYSGIEGEPPKRVLGSAQFQGARFLPEPFVMPDGTFGFHEDAGEVAQRMLVIRPDGTARYSDTSVIKTLEGRCKRMGD